MTTLDIATDFRPNETAAQLRRRRFAALEADKAAKRAERRQRFDKLLGLRLANRI